MLSQLFGYVETSEGNANAMLCIDKDIPNEFMIHIWGQGITSKAILVLASEISPKTYNLQTIKVYSINQRGGLIEANLTQDEVRYYKGLTAELVESDEGVNGFWADANEGKGVIHFSKELEQQEINPVICNTWAEFKNWTIKVRDEDDVFIFRGHSSHKYRLETTLSRSGRNRLERYCAEELLQFKEHAEAILGNRIDMNNGDDYAMLLGLAQHHGLPTPLLDWTKSPYIAAFFAFSNALEHASERDSTYVRIFGITREFYKNKSPLTVVLPFIEPYICCLSVSSLNNPRLYAQQGQFLVTNVVNLSTLLTGIDVVSGKKSLCAVDMPITIAAEVLEDLAYMGLTAANLFPGLDGVSKMIRHEMQFKRKSNIAPPIDHSESASTSMLQNEFKK